MTPEIFINAKLTMQERIIPVLINSEMIYKLMEQYAQMKVQEQSEIKHDVIEMINRD